MANLNKVMLMGNLTRDPELKYTPSGMAVARLGMAINRKFRDSKTNELREEVTFVDVEVWGKQAETVKQYMVKGKPIYIEGRLKLDTWDDKNTGQKVSKMKVVCEGFQFLGSAGQGGGGGYSSGQPAAQRPPAPARPQPARPPSQPHEPMAPPQDFGGDMQDQGQPPEDLQISEENVPF